ncbi:NAD(P)H-hydrate dehydratase [Sphingomonas glaciei]|uniref:ADP-dependent (S)-NAD(P)H-hydrate dehydratase n=1 Tax=Sphingomonas glaciei TaxID=2938948 RepID=A0ABY5MXB2_9SPHN|nr:NAD(P)H-hydrate dehydratase [Sphingomonas glaciei]UUR06991.1 NAD(P)H-hydrate dehydratase [Sphingomonas glaciei]
MSEPVELDPDTLKRYPLPPIAGGDKDERGSILIIAGSREVSGAALLTAMGAMRSGAGRLQIVTVASAAPGLSISMPEAMVTGMAEGRDGGFAPSTVKPIAERAAQADVVVAGPGMRGNKSTEALAEALVGGGQPLVLDAALLHALPARRGEVQRAECPTILLPHSGEMASLLGCDEAEVDADPVAAGRRCTERYDCLTLVKGVQSHIVAPDGRAFRYPGGGPGLGVSGSGDTLAGIVGGLLARRADPLAALLWGVWCHGEAGRRLGERIGTLGFLAREIPGEVPGILRDGGML